MASLAASAVLALAASPLVSATDTGPYIFGKRQSTCSKLVESCSSAASSVSTCCVNTPGGQFLQVQFWDTDPVEGPSNSWGIHGLWPDNCSGGYQSSCDSSRAYTDITSLIQQYGTDDLLDFMETYWNSNSESNELFWEHEWSKHGTCISTLEPDCYANYQTGIEAVDFFQITVNLFSTLNTYETLAAAGITPSSSKTYTLSAISNAISKSFGADPILLCTNNELTQIYYGFYATGPLANQDFTPAAVVGDDSTCPSSGISYLPKSQATTTVAYSTFTATALPTAGTGTTTRKTTTTTTSSGSSATGTAVSGKGYWYAYYNGAQKGCLISGGTWYTSGTCATFTATTSGSGFTMTSSKGNCGIVDDQLECASGVSATKFTAVNGYLAHDGSTAFYANSVPSGSTQVDVWTDYGDYDVTFKWTAV